MSVIGLCSLSGKLINLIFIKLKLINFIKNQFVTNYLKKVSVNK